MIKRVSKDRISKVLAVVARHRRWVSAFFWLHLGFRDGNASNSAGLLSESTLTSSRRIDVLQVVGFGSLEVVRCLSPSPLSLFQFLDGRSKLEFVMVGAPVASLILLVDTR